MKGSEYIAVRNLYTRDGLVAAAGERCDFVPVESLPWLLQGGLIQPAPVADQAPVKKGKA